MNGTTIPPLPVPEIKGFGIVRDADGHPKVDDLTTLPREIWDAFTEEDKAWLSR